MTLLSDFESDLSGIFDPVDGLGTAVTLAGTAINALVRYETDADDNGAKFEVMDLDVLRTSYDAVPAYRAVAVVEGKTWYYWRQVAGDEVSRRLRFRSNERFQFDGGKNP